MNSYFILGMLSFWKYLFLKSPTKTPPMNDQEFCCYIWGGKAAAFLLILLFIVPCFLVLWNYGS